MVCATRSLVAVGFVGAMAAATSTPTLAQGVHFEGCGFGVDIGRPDCRYHRGYRDDYAWDRGSGHRRTVTIERDNGGGACACAVRQTGRPASRRGVGQGGGP